MRPGLLFATWVGVAAAAEPTFTHVHPAGVQRGTECAVRFTGKFDPWPCRVWADAPGIEVTPGEKAGNFTVKVAADVPAGPHLLRAFNAEGASAPVILVIDDAVQTLEAEGNDSPGSAQAIEKLPAVVNGNHETANDVDAFAVTLRKGETLVAWVEAYVLAAGFDAMLRIVDARGVTVAFNHDDVTLDPFLAFTAPVDGRYIVETMGHKYPASTDVRFASGGDCIYRLHLTNGAFVRHTWPLVVPTNSVKVGLCGWNLGATEINLDPRSKPAFPVRWSDAPQFTDAEPMTPLPMPAGFSGRLSSEHPVAEIPFAVEKGVPLTVSATAREFGSQIDPWLAICGPDGKEIARNDDADGTSDAAVTWTPETDGIFTAKLGDLTHRTGKDCYFHLSLARAQPTVTATVAAHSVTIEAGKTAAVKTNVVLANGFSQKLQACAADLPAGITCAETDVPGKGGEVSLTLTAAAGAQAVSCPIRILVKVADSDLRHPARFMLTTSSENNGVPQGYQTLLVSGADSVWLTVVPAKEAVSPPK